jgi:aminotransferase
MRAHIKNLIAKRESELPKTEFEEIMRIAAEDKSVISLGPGEPDFDTPRHIREAAKRALDQGKTHYTPVNGIHELREELAKKLGKQNDIGCDPDTELIVTNGSSESLFTASMAMIEPGDKVLVPNPGYVDYIPLTDLMEGQPVSIKLSHENNFDIDTDFLRKKIDNKTHVMILNYPSNPTGRVIKRKKLEEIADIVMEHNMMVFSDEAYESFTYGNNKHISLASLNGMHDRVASFFTFSKSYAMAGFRIGYCVAPAELIKAMTRIRLYSSISSPAFCQEAALEALRNPRDEVERMRKEYERRGRMLHRRLAEMGDWFRCNEPEGAFYMFPNIEAFGMSSIDLAHMMLQKAKVLVVPGTEFGSYGEGYVRMSYATSYEKIQEAMDRIEIWLKSFK